MSRGSANLFRYWATALIVTQAASCRTVSTAAGPNVQAEWEVEEPQLATPKAVPGAPIATKGLWVVRTTLSHPDSVRAMVRRAAGAGFNTLLVQVRGRGDAYYLGGIDPPADAIRARADFDPLALTISYKRTVAALCDSFENGCACSGTIPCVSRHVLARINSRKIIWLERICIRE